MWKEFNGGVRQIHELMLIGPIVLLPTPWSNILPPRRTEAAFRGCGAACRPSPPESGRGKVRRRGGGPRTERGINCRLRQILLRKTARPQQRKDSSSTRSPPATVASIPKSKTFSTGCWPPSRAPTPRNCCGWNVFLGRHNSSSTRWAASGAAVVGRMSNTCKCPETVECTPAIIVKTIMVDIIR